MFASKEKRGGRGRLIVVGATSLLILAALLVWFGMFRSRTIGEFRATQATQNDNTIFFDRDNEPFHVIRGAEDRKYVRIEDIGGNLQKAVIAIEDARFFRHFGIDPIRVGDAILRILRFRDNLHGASTITQQLVKMTLLSPERLFSRKIKEMAMAIALETEFSKTEILEFYLNKIYLGHRNFGVENVSLHYFHKSAGELTLAESAFVAGLIKKPEGYSPFVDLKKARLRQITVLERMLRLGLISADEYKRAYEERILIRRKKEESWQQAPFFVNHILLQLKKRYGHKIVYGGGLRIHTTLDRKMQEAMDRAVSEKPRRENGFAEIAGVSIEADTGFVRALVGGSDFFRSEFNRATQARRQPGSAFKPILYSAAISSGIKTDDVFVDEPILYANAAPDGENSGTERAEADPTREIRDAFAEIPERDRLSFYEPSNFSNDHKGPITVAHALITSNNVVSVKILDRIGIDYLATVSERFGIPLPKERGLCLALGCLETTLLDLVAAYTTFPNRGVRVRPTFVRKVTDNRGNVLEVFDRPEEARVLSADNAYLVDRLLQEVVESGTGRNAKSDRPSAGKTGTSDDFRDAWYVGYTPELVTGFWTGNDDNTPMDGEVGGGTPADLWKSYTERLPDSPYRREFAPNEKFEEFLICNHSGKPANRWCPSVAWYFLPKETAPPEQCGIHRESETEIKICSESGKLATGYCPIHAVEARFFHHGAEPAEYCDIH